MLEKICVSKRQELDWLSLWDLEEIGRRKFQKVLGSHDVVDLGRMFVTLCRRAIKQQVPSSFPTIITTHNDTGELPSVIAALTDQTVP